jgi:hypothetical protein
VLFLLRKEGELRLSSPPSYREDVVNSLPPLRREGSSFLL